MQNFGVTNKEHYGMLWYFLEWPITVTDSCKRLFQTFGIGSNGSGYPFGKKRLSLLTARATRSKKMSFVAKPACVTLPRLQTKPHGATHGQFLFRTPAPLVSIRQEIMHCPNR